MSYLAVKHSHLMLVVLSVVFFYFRFFHKQIRKQELAKWMRIAPHIIDTFLLASAVMLCVLIQQYPGVHFWLTAKLAFVIGYIGFAMAAMKSEVKAKAISFMAVSSVCLILAAKFAVTKGHF